MKHTQISKPPLLFFVVRKEGRSLSESEGVSVLSCFKVRG